MNEPVTGGCQCGAVRYRIDRPLKKADICHCRMCQKAFGNYFAALVNVDRDAITWTNDRPSHFASSEAAVRGFCPKCGTPLTYEYDRAAHISVSIGSLDHPAAVTPERQYGIEARLPAFALLHTLPGIRTEDDIPREEMARYASRQHPDHE
jgi:hypothetical protein